MELDLVVENAGRAMPIRAKGGKDCTCREWMLLLGRERTRFAKLMAHSKKKDSSDMDMSRRNFMHGAAAAGTALAFPLLARTERAPYGARRAYERPSKKAAAGLQERRRT